MRTSPASSHTTSECLALGKATVFYEAAPGQESANARFAADLGAAILGRSPETTGQAAAFLVHDAEARATLAARARRVGRPAAAHVIAEAVLARLGAARGPALRAA